MCVDILKIIHLPLPIYVSFEWPQRQIFTLKLIINLQVMWRMQINDFVFSNSSFKRFQKMTNNAFHIFWCFRDDNLGNFAYASSVPLVQWTFSPNVPDSNLRWDSMFFYSFEQTQMNKTKTYRFLKILKSFDFRHIWILKIPASQVFLGANSQLLGTSLAGARMPLSMFIKT